MNTNNKNLPLVISIFYALSLVVYMQDAKAEIIRSKAAISAFKRANPCPANGNRSGPCGGYVVDHIVPLCAGGPDSPLNMQWQSKVDGLVKDKDEWALCKIMKRRLIPLGKIKFL